SHLCQAGDLAELPFERSRDGAGNGLRISAWKLRGDQDRRRVDIRQGRHRQQLVADQAEQQDRRHQHASGDRPADEHRRNVHGNSPELAGVGFGTAAGSFGLARETMAPGVSRYWPRTTTVSPALKPLSISASPLSVSSTKTGCIATL